MFIITKQQAKNYLLTKAGFNSDRNFLQVINDLSCIQVDPINIVARTHELSLYNRSKNFRKKDLYKSLYEDHSLFEYWMQLYSIIPIQAFPYLHGVDEVPGDRQREISGYWHEDYRKQHKKEIDIALEFIKDNGPTSSKQILHLPKVPAIHSWKGEDSQIALLEFLWNTGEIQVSHRKSNTKYYDLTERVLPKSVRDMKVTREESYKFLLDSYFKYFGLIRSSRLNRSGRNRAQGLRDELAKQIKNSHAVEIRIEGGLYKYYAKQSEVEKLQNSPSGSHKGLNVLPPLDPMIIDRELTVDVFDFFYRWEAYTPQSKRKYGYYNMPILFNGEIIGQIDLVKDNQENKLKVNKLALNKKSKQIDQALKSELKRLEEFSFS
ncbi:MAG: crosslink repair DNA glycosylase YcaQ family protein [Candidatus Dojkabacteria bacterium]